ncbi:hypothetical protein MSAN_01110700 [Mycena sanguinolenta]|uniref:Uncharacterized protein n=1 Tax=Mycena sanguinolenta TaxID=230812 RepID=A0A8H6YLI1_9AGAR|nr:hypothetical protein MSAN_01110700 [Mycena sanguinolenta]
MSFGVSEEEYRGKYAARPFFFPWRGSRFYHSHSYVARWPHCNAVSTAQRNIYLWTPAYPRLDAGVRRLPRHMMQSSTTSRRRVTGHRALPLRTASKTAQPLHDISSLAGSRLRYTTAPQLDSSLTYFKVDSEVPSLPVPRSSSSRWPRGCACRDTPLLRPTTAAPSLPQSVSLLYLRLYRHLVDLA